MFRPLRSRVQGFIDRHSYRRKYDVAKTLDQFSQRLRVELNLESLTRELMDVINRTWSRAKCRRGSDHLWRMKLHLPEPPQSPRSDGAEMAEDGSPRGHRVAPRRGTIG